MIKLNELNIGVISVPGSVKFVSPFDGWLDESICRRALVFAADVLDGR
jgi:hypothetical protein